MVQPAISDYPGRARVFMRSVSRSPLKRLVASLMLALAMVYLLHAVQFAAAGEVPPTPPGQAAVVNFDLFVFAQSQTGDGVVGCHFFCVHDCPVPPLPTLPGLPAGSPRQTSFPAPMAPAGLPDAQPETAPPRLLA